MSRYQPLEQHLARQTGREHPMTFGEIERVIGTPLPASARVHRPWWSNNEASNVATGAWRRAGWKSARVDMAGERLVFVRDCEAPPQPSLVSAPTDSGPPSAPAAAQSVAAIVLPLDRLSAAARRLLAEEAELHDGDQAAAIASLLHALASERKRQLISGFVGQSRPGRDSVELIREDRDAR